MFEDPNNDEKTHYDDLMDKCIVDHDTGLRLLPFDKPSKGVLSQSSSEASIAQAEDVVSLDKQSIASAESPKLVKTGSDVEEEEKIEDEQLVKEERLSEKSGSIKSSSKSSSGADPTGDVVAEETVPEVESPVVEEEIDEQEPLEAVSPSLSEHKEADVVSISSKTSKTSSKPVSEPDQPKMTHPPSDIVSEKSESVLSDDAVTVVKLFTSAWRLCPLFFHPLSWCHPY